MMRVPILNKDMQLCISLSGRPSNIGTRFHNYLYDELGLNFAYKAFTTTDLAAAIGGVRALGIRGCSVSMPFKEDALALVDDVEPSAASIASLNTIVNDDGRLTASNTDYEAVERLLREHGVRRDASVLVRGSGGMAKAVVAAFRGTGFDDVTVLARNGEAGRRLANGYGYAFLSEVPERGRYDVVVNVTPLGMDGAGARALAFPERLVAAAETVFDVVAFPWRTPLVALAEERGIPVITGAEVIAYQAARQFERYTGVTPTDEQVARASAFSRE